MNHWLFKTEPETFSWEMQKKRGAKGEPWSGVRNFAAAKHMKAMKKGDRVYFYHSNASPSAVAGIAEVAKEAYPDSTALDPKHDHFDPKSKKDDPTWFMVDIKAVEKLKRPVSLDEIKKSTALAGMALVKLGRLSVSPVTEAEWNTIVAMANKPAASPAR